MAAIEDVVTRQGSKGKGFASLLIEKLISEARKAKVFKIVLSAKESNKEFYEKFGFKPDQISMKYD